MLCRLRVLAVLGVVAVGCDAPRLVPVAPPGLEYTQVTPDTEEPAEALGESRGAGGQATTPTSAELAKTAPPLAEPTEPGQSKTTASGLTYETIKPGSGAQAEAGKTAVVHYTGTLTDGTQFDSSRGKQPYPVQIGVSSVIPGWHEGLAGMKVGEVRKLTIPPNLAYGDQGRPPRVPPKSTLVFEIELMDVH